MDDRRSLPARFRPILTFSLIAILLVLMWVGLEVYFALTAKPDPTVDYGAKLMEHAAAWQGGDESDDVWSVLIEAVELHQRLIDGLVDEDTGTAYTDLEWGYEAVSGYDEHLNSIAGEADGSGDWFHYDSEADAIAHLDLCRVLTIESLSEWDERGILARLDRVAAGQRAIRPFPDTTQTQLINMLLPELGNMRNMAKGLRVQMILARDAGDWEAYSRAFEHAMAIGRNGCYQQVLIERLVGNSIRALAVGQVHEDVMAGRLPSEALAMVDAAIERQSRIPPMSYAFEGERAMGLDMVQWLHDSRGRLILSEIRTFGGMGGGGRHPIVNVASIAYPRKDTVEQKFHDIYDEIVIWCNQTVHQRRGQRSKADVMVEEIYQDWRYPILDVFIPAFRQAVRSAEQIELQVFGLKTMIAIERYRLDAGGIPESLADLVPEYLHELPVDLYGDGQALLQYSVFDEADKSGRQYLMYSVGYDNADNGGVESESPLDAFRRIGKGTDYIINRTNSPN